MNTLVVHIRLNHFRQEPVLYSSSWKIVMEKARFLVGYALHNSIVHRLAGSLFGVRNQIRH